MPDGHRRPTGAKDRHETTVHVITEWAELGEQQWDPANPGPANTLALAVSHLAGGMLRLLADHAPQMRDGVWVCTAGCLQVGTTTSSFAVFPCRVAEGVIGSILGEQQAPDPLRAVLALQDSALTDALRFAASELGRVASLSPDEAAVHAGVVYDAMGAFAATLGAWAASHG